LSDEGVAALVWHAGVVEVVFALEHLGPAADCMRARFIRIGRARLDQTDRHIGILAQSRCDDRTGSPSADYKEVHEVLGVVCHGDPFNARRTRWSSTR
jgi:hypothetical protein